HSRCHGAGDTTHREPWAFSQEALEIFRRYDKLRYSLMPYIYEEAEKCTRTGLPMMRALYLEYPEDRNVRTIDDQYLFGDSLLIAPVLKPLSKSKTRDVYLPKGVWYDYFTKEKLDSCGMWIKRDIDLATMPIYVREGAVLKYCSADTHLKGGMGEIIKTEKW
ncbi:MAG: alpha-xylosidase, partial [Abditibacteriota bacterium]|nr:alpha-xylosidase [Abditibacteriota bacterium]